MKNIFVRHRKTVLMLFCLAVVTTSATAVYIYYSNPRFKPADTSTPEAQAAAFLPNQPPEDLTTLNVLLLGYGGPGHQGGYLSDVIQLVHIDFEKEKVALISIPRDLWVQLPNNSAAKINQAFTLGNDPKNLVKSGGQIAKQMASTITGLNVNYFIAVDFVGFQRLIGENLDAIEVNVPETLDDPWYPVRGEELNPCSMTPEKIADVTAQYSGFELEKQFPCRYEHIRYEQGRVKMEGGDALKYVRSRHGSSAGDFSRSQRQHALLKAIRDRLFTLNVLNDVPNFYNIITKNVTSDISLDIAEYIAPALQNGNNFEVQSVVLSTDNVLTSSRSSSGQSILIPKTGLNNWNELQQFIQTELKK